MTSVIPHRRRVHSWSFGFIASAVAALFVLSGGTCPAAEKEAPPIVKNGVVKVPAAIAKTEAEMKPYTELLTSSTVKFDMVPIRGGTFVMGSPKDEEDRGEGEGPQFKAKIEPFWMGKHEVTWDEFETFMLCLDMKYRKFKKVEATALELKADGVAHPTKPYTDMTFGMGKDGYPAICMTQLSVRMYCKWLSEKTGRYYRLPTEAEWEYACRAGTTTTYSFGNTADDLDDYAWHVDNSDEKYHKVGKKKPNPWGLHDMHGNVAEWVLDQYDKNHYQKFAGKTATRTLAIPTKLYPRVVRGGSWDDDPDLLRSSARVYSDEDWKEQDPQFPQSIWYHTDALHVGFRVVRPLAVPSAEELKNYWDAGTMLPKKQKADKVGCNEE